MQFKQMVLCNFVSLWALFMGEKVTVLLSKSRSVILSSKALLPKLKKSRCRPRGEHTGHGGRDVRGERDDG